jgi:hypothetical protein
MVLTATFCNFLNVCNCLRFTSLEWNTTKKKKRVGWWGEPAAKLLEVKLFNRLKYKVTYIITQWNRHKYHQYHRQNRICWIYQDTFAFIHQRLLHCKNHDLLGIKSPLKVYSVQNLQNFQNYNTWHGKKSSNTDTTVTLRTYTLLSVSHRNVGRNLLFRTSYNLQFFKAYRQLTI